MNVIWLMGDQHRAQALSSAADSNVDTPNIDGLKNNGVTFTGAVAGSPLCSPFRGSMLTSNYPHKCIPGHGMPMPHEMPTIADVFNENGYRTAYFGKWHVEGEDASYSREAFHIVPRDRRGGFEKWIGYENNCQPFDCWVHGNDSDGTDIELHKLEGFETDALTELLVNYLKERGAEKTQGHEKPFFAVLSVTPPHSEYTAPERWRKKFSPESIVLRSNVPQVNWVTDKARTDLAGYYAAIENWDWNIGRIRQELKNSVLADDTLIIFFSDHGDMHGSHGCFYKCVPYEESIKIPFIIAGAGEKQQKETPRKTDVPFNHVDIAPTTLGLCGIEKKAWMQGHDYSYYFFPDKPHPDNEPASAFLQLVDPGYKNGFAVDRERPWRGIITRDGWKYAVFEHQPWMMFNLNDDPYETANLAWNGSFAEKRKELQDCLEKWLEQTADEFELPQLSNYRYRVSM